MSEIGVAERLTRRYVRDATRARHPVLSAVSLIVPVVAVAALILTGSPEVFYLAAMTVVGASLVESTTVRAQWKVCLEPIRALCAATDLPTARAVLAATAVDRRPPPVDVNDMTNRLRAAAQSLVQAAADKGCRDGHQEVCSHRLGRNPDFQAWLTALPQH